MSKSSKSKGQPSAQPEMTATARQKEEPLLVSDFGKEVQEYAKKYREQKSIQDIMGHDQFMRKHLNQSI